MSATEDLHELTDKALLARHTTPGDDGRAFGELFRRHRDRMYAVALRTTSDPELAADCVQEAFISAFRRAAAYRGEAAVTTWLHRIVVNACLDRLRSPHVLRRGADLAEVELPVDGDRPEQVTTRVLVYGALAALPEAQRVALVLVDLEGFSITDAAAVLEVAEGTVKSRCSRGRQALVAELARRGWPPDPEGTE